MNKEELAEILIKKFTDYSADFDNHLSKYGKLLGHVFFGDIIDRQLFRLLKNDGDEYRIKALFDFINDLYLLGDDECKNIVIVTILEYLGDDKEVLNKAYQYLERNLIEESIKNEQFLGRL